MMASQSAADLTVRTVGDRKNPRQVIVLLHGWGASGDDLVPLGAALAAPARLFVFPAAPLPAPFGGGRAWWPLDLAALEAARAAGRERDLREVTPEGLLDVEVRLLALLDELERDLHVPRSAIVLGGFSQGAMLATDVTLMAERRPRALVVLSGTVVAERRWRAAMAAGKPAVPVFLSHGRQDPVLPFRLATELERLLTEAGHPVTWLPFEGGHGIPPVVLKGVDAFLAGLLPP
jgi:phospholipase/carboxylesterase